MNFTKFPNHASHSPPPPTNTLAHFSLHLRIFRFVRKTSKSCTAGVATNRGRHFGGCMAIRYTTALQVVCVCLFYFPLFTRCQNGTWGGALMRRNANDICCLITTTINISTCFCLSAGALVVGTHQLLKYLFSSVIFAGKEMTDFLRMCGNEL